MILHRLMKKWSTRKSDSLFPHIPLHLQMMSDNYIIMGLLYFSWSDICVLIFMLYRKHAIPAKDGVEWFTSNHETAFIHPLECFSNTFNCCCICSLCLSARCGQPIPPPVPHCANTHLLRDIKQTKTISNRNIRSVCCIACKTDVRQLCLRMHWISVLCLHLYLLSKRLHAVLFCL